MRPIRTKTEKKETEMTEEEKDKGRKIAKKAYAAGAATAAAGVCVGHFCPELWPWLISAVPGISLGTPIDREDDYFDDSARVAGNCLTAGTFLLLAYGFRNIGFIGGFAGAYISALIARKYCNEKYQGVTKFAQAAVMSAVVLSSAYCLYQLKMHPEKRWEGGKKPGGIEQVVSSNSVNAIERNICIIPGYR